MNNMTHHFTALLLWVISPLVLAAPTLQFDVTGKLSGADNVDVAGALYNVRFIDGSCIGVFSGCGAVTAFAFKTQQQALLASQALLDGVLIDEANGYFDSQPQTTRGCFDNGLCMVLTPYAVTSSLDLSIDLVFTANAYNFRPQQICRDFVCTTSDIDSVGSQNFGFGTDFDTGAQQGFAETWAQWTAVSTTVPEPSTLTSVTLSLLAMCSVNRRRNKNKS